MISVDDLVLTQKLAEDALNNNPDASSGALTFGPTENNLTSNYSAGKGSWDLVFIDKINCDILLIYQSKLSQLYRKTKTAVVTPPLPRAIKDKLIRDYFPVHTINNLRG